MFEVTLLFLIAVSAYLLWENNLLFTRKPHQQAAIACDASLDIGLEDPVDKDNFLNYLQNEIESALFPRPTDSVLQRHYDSLVNAELENRLAAMPDS